MATEFEMFSGQVEFQSSGQGALDNTSPTFAGIAGATPNDDGSISVNWALASSSKPPVYYHVYIALGVVSAASLFIDANVTAHVPPGKTSGKVFLLPDQMTYLVKGQQYTLGVRSTDAFGYADTNMVTLQATAVASGNLPAVFQDIADALDLDHDNFVGDHQDFQDDHANFQDDHANFQDDHANFQDDHTNFDNDHTNLVSDIAALEIVAGSIAAGGGTQLSAEIPETTMTIETESII